MAQKPQRRWRQHRLEDGVHPPRMRTLCTSLGIALQHGLSDPRGWPLFPTSESRQLTERIYYSVTVENV